MSDDDDNDYDFAAAFRRLVKITEEQTKLQKRAIEKAEREVHGFHVEVSASDMRRRLGAHAAKLRESLACMALLPTLEEIQAAVVYDGDGNPLPLPDRILSWSKDPNRKYRPNLQLLSEIETLANWCIEWAAMLTDESKVFIMSPYEWGQIFGRPDHKLC